MADIFRYISENPAHRSTVKAVDGGDYYLELRRGSKTGRTGRTFQTIEEWMMRMEGRGYFTMPDWSHFGAVRDACLPLMGSFYYEDPECPQEKRSLLFLKRRGIYVQLRHGASNKRTYFATFADWAATLPVGGRLYAEHTHLSVPRLFLQYLALYDLTDAKTDVAHYLTFFLLVNKDELLREIPLAALRSDIREFLADAQFEYNNALLDRVRTLYFAKKVARVRRA